MPVAEVYCNPALLTGGNGSVGNPYGDVQLALNSFIHNGSGMRLNILEGSTEFLTGYLDPTTYLNNNGPALITEPLIIQGYRVTPGDGGSGYLDGQLSGTHIWGGNTSGADFDFLTLQDLILRPGGSTSAYAIVCDNNCTIKNCDMSGSNFGIDIDGGTVEGCRIVYGGSGNAVCIAGAFGVAQALNNHIICVSGTPGTAFTSVSTAINNIFDMRNANANNAVLLTVNGLANTFIGNTIISNASGTANSWHGIRCYHPNAYISNNIIHGFNRGIDVSNASYGSILANNKFYSNGTNIVDSGVNTIIIGGSGSLTSSGINGVTFSPSSELIDAGYPTGYLGLSIRNYPTVGAIKTAHTGGGVGAVNPLGGFLI